MAAFCEQHEATSWICICFASAPPVVYTSQNNIVMSSLLCIHNASWNAERHAESLVQLELCECNKLYGLLKQHEQCHRTVYLGAAMCTDPLFSHGLMKFRSAL